MSLNSTDDQQSEWQEASEPHVYSVSELNRGIRQTLEGEFPILWLKGEISNFKPHTSGHWYFSLKDAKAQIAAVMFRGFNQSLRFRPRDGMEVIVRGKITVYEPRGNYQIFCEVMEPVGAGAMQMAFEQLKAKLQKEGLFEASRKRPLPLMPQHVAVVTSPTGAAIRDILNVLNRRFRGLRVTLIPAVVQGDQAPAQIVSAIERANCLTDVDVLIVGRGGGSIEDLWCFNSEQVARAIAASRIPTISAVGHEIDFTIADFVADVRAPTPSAAAELVVKSSAELMERVRLLSNHLQKLIHHKFELWRRHNRVLQQRLTLVDPKRRLEDLAQRCDELMQRLEQSWLRWRRDQGQKIEILRHRLGSPEDQVRQAQQRLNLAQTQLRAFVQMVLDRKRASLGQSAALLDSLSPLGVLDRGYALALHGGKVVRRHDQVQSGDELAVKVATGVIHTVVQRTEKN